MVGKLPEIPESFDDPISRSIFDKGRYLYPGINIPEPPEPNLESEETRDEYCQVYRKAFERTYVSGSHHLIVKSESVRTGCARAAIEAFEDVKSLGIEVEDAPPRLVVDALVEGLELAISSGEIKIQEPLTQKRRRWLPKL